MTIVAALPRLSITASVGARPEIAAGAPRTAHGAASVDDPARLAESVDVATLTGVHGVGPLPHTELLDALARSQVVVTDSGAVQEVASWLGIPAVVSRDTAAPAARMGARLFAEQAA